MNVNLKSKFSIAQTILIPAYLLLTTFGVTGILLFAGSIALGKSDNRGFLLLGFGLVFLALSLLIVRHYVNIFNRINLNLEGIRIKGLFSEKMIKWTEIKKINLLGKEDEKFMFTSIPMEAASLITAQGDKKVILVKLYSNMDKIRTALHFINMKIERNEAITSDCFIQTKRFTTKISSISNFTKYGGNHLLSFNGLLVYGGLSFTLWLFLFADSPMNIIAKSIICGFMILFCVGFYGYQLHYFEINQEYLVVKNHIWAWKNDVYLIKDLRELVFEEPYRMSTSLRVITNTYETKLYPAGSLRNKSWSRLIMEFSKMGLQIRNEAYFE